MSDMGKCLERISDLELKVKELESERDDLLKRLNEQVDRAEQVEADCAVMRGVLEWILDGLQKNALDAKPIQEALATDSGKALLSRLKEATDLLSDQRIGYFRVEDCRDWWERRQKFLGKPQPW